MKVKTIEEKLDLSSKDNVILCPCGSKNSVAYLCLEQFEDKWDNDEDSKKGEESKEEKKLKF